MEAVGECEKVAVMVMGKMRDTGRMVVKDSKTGEEKKRRSKKSIKMLAGFGMFH